MPTRRDVRLIALHSSSPLWSSRQLQFQAISINADSECHNVSLVCWPASPPSFPLIMAHCQHIYILYDQSYCTVIKIIKLIRTVLEILWWPDPSDPYSTVRNSIATFEGAYIFFCTAETDSSSNISISSSSRNRIEQDPSSNNSSTYPKFVPLPTVFN